MLQRTDDALYDGIAAGGAALGRKLEMPALGATVGAAAIRALVRHVRALCDSVGPAWSRTSHS
jgi:hypothetical protein